MLRALGAHIDWVDDHALAYRAVLQAGISSDPNIQAILQLDVSPWSADWRKRSNSTFYSQLSESQSGAGSGSSRARVDRPVAGDITQQHLARLLAAAVAGALTGRRARSIVTDSHSAF